MEGKEIRVYGTLVNNTQGTVSDSTHNDILMNAYQLYDGRFINNGGVLNYQDVINKRVTGITYNNGNTTISGNLTLTGNIWNNGQTIDISALKSAIDTLTSDENTPNSIRNVVASYIAQVINGADPRFDTLKEIADWIIANPQTGTGGVLTRLQSLETRMAILEAKVLVLEDQAIFTSYVATFVDWDGRLLKTLVVNNGGSATPPANPSRSGYNFTGWSPSNMNIQQDTVFTALYSVRSYTIRFEDYNGSLLKELLCNYDSMPIPPNDPSRTGYTFSGWSPSIAAVTGPQTYTAQYTREQCTVAWYLYSGLLYVSQTYNYGDTVTPPENPTRSGYTFSGWDHDPSGVIVNTNLVFTATWVIDHETPTEKDYKVIWNFLNGLAAREDEYWANEQLIIPSDPTYTGMRFDGWDPYPTNAQVPNGESNPLVAFPDGKVTHNAIFNAVWELVSNSYIITWNPNGGTVQGHGSSSWTEEYLENEQLQVPSNPTRSGYEFEGWDPTPVAGSNVTSDQTYTAVWSIPENPSGDTYIVKWNLQGGNINGDTSFILQTYSLGDLLIKPQDPVRDGMIFSGWDPDATYIERVTQNYIFNAVWDETPPLTTYTITWNPNNSGNTPGSGDSPWTETYTEGLTIHKPSTDPTWTGHNFLGWEGYYEGIKVYSDHTFLATWEVSSDPGLGPFYVKWNLQGGNVNGNTNYIELEYNYGDPLHHPEPTYTGMHFEGWDPDVAEGTPVTQNYIFNAIWDEINYYVEFVREPNDLTGNYQLYSNPQIVYSHTYHYGDKVHVPHPDSNEITVYTGDANNPTTTTKTFDGWAGGFVPYNDGDAETMYNTITVDGTIYIWAEYSDHSAPVTYEVRWNYGGQRDRIIQTYNEGDTLTVPVTYNMGASYLFDINGETYSMIYDGWDPDPWSTGDQSSPNYVGGYGSSGIVNHDGVFNAIWKEPITVLYTDSNNYASAAGSPNLTVNISDQDGNSGQWTSGPNGTHVFTKEFKGTPGETVNISWSCNGQSGTSTSTWSGTWSFDLSQVYTPGPVKHTVKWDPNGGYVDGHGSSPWTEEYNDGEQLTYPNDPTRPNYSFEKWQGDIDYLSDHVYTDRDYTAVWSFGNDPDTTTHSVKWNFMDGTTPQLIESYDDGDTINIPRGTANDWDPNPYTEYSGGAVDHDCIFNWITGLDSKE